jgi:hypothetical protein
MTSMSLRLTPKRCSVLKLIHASCLDPPLAGRAYYLILSDGSRVPTSLKTGMQTSRAMRMELEIVRPPKRSPLTQRQRNERSGRCGVWVSDAVVRECVEMLNNLEGK